MGDKIQVKKKEEVEGKDAVSYHLEVKVKLAVMLGPDQVAVQELEADPGQGLDPNLALVLDQDHSLEVDQGLDLDLGQGKDLGLVPGQDLVAGQDLVVDLDLDLGVDQDQDLEVGLQDLEVDLHKALPILDPMLVHPILGPILVHHVLDQEVHDQILEVQGVVEQNQEGKAIIQDQAAIKSCKLFSFRGEKCNIFTFFLIDF